jgi:hypothetical protein
MADTNLSNDLLPTIDLQRWLQYNHYLPSDAELPITIATPFGPKSLDAARHALVKFANITIPSSWTDDRIRTALEQLLIKITTGYDLGTIDGLAGTRTLYGLELYQNRLRDAVLSPSNISSPTIIKTGTPIPTSATPILFPRQRDVQSVYGTPGTPDCHAICDNLPFYLRMDGSLSKTAQAPIGTADVSPIKRVSLHRKLHDSFRSILNEVLAHYGPTQIQALGLNQFAGAYNYRPMRGSTKTLSMHAYGAAVDFDAQRNSLHETARTARFARREYKPFIDIFYDHGWISLGRERNFDWMHFQAVRL